MWIVTRDSLLSIASLSSCHPLPDSAFVSQCAAAQSAGLYLMILPKIPQ